MSVIRFSEDEMKQLKNVTRLAREINLPLDRVYRRLDSIVTDQNLTPELIEFVKDFLENGDISK